MCATLGTLATHTTTLSMAFGVVRDTARLTLESPTPQLPTSRDLVYFVDGAGAGSLSSLSGTPQ